MAPIITYAGEEAQFNTALEQLFAVVVERGGPMEAFLAEQWR